MKESKAIIISGFPGTGKSTAAVVRRDCYDCDSSEFHYVTVCDPTNPNDPGVRKENPDWVKDYVNHIEAAARDPRAADFLLISSHKAVRDELNRREIPYIVVIPKIDLRDHYMARYLRRGNSIEMITRLYANWYSWLDEMRDSGAPVIHLGAEQYIQDILPPERYLSPRMIAKGGADEHDPV